MRAHIISLFLAATTASSAPSLDAAGSCDVGFTICSPPGATSATTPQIGSQDFQNLFVDIIGSSLPAFKRSLAHSARASTSLCCNAQLSCLTMATLALPFCYDKFTTNFVLPDGSSGTVVGGSYRSAKGDIANLETGDYTLANGQTGNIYSSNPSAKPNIATLPIPSQFTASGVGSAIPVASLGSEIIVTYTTTLPGSTIPASTISPSIISATTSTTMILVPVTTTVSPTSGSSPSLSVGALTSYSVVKVLPSTVPGTIIDGSTVAPTVETITTTEFSALTSSTPTASPTSKKNDGARVGHEWGGIWAFCISIMFF